jgi:hypothetical protein
MNPKINFACVPHRPYLNGAQRPLSWIKRRARKLERVYVIPRRIAILNARIDWAHFHPVTTH